MLVCETGFALTAFVAIALNLLLREEVEDEVVDEVLTANKTDEEADREEWKRIEGKRKSSDDVEKVGEGVGGGQKIG